MFSRFLFFIRMGRGAKAYAPSDVPVKGTSARIQFRRQSPKGNRPGTMVPDCGAYSIRPYPDGRKNMIIFLTTDMQRFPIFIRQTICRPLCIRRNGIGPQAPDLGSSSFSSVRVGAYCIRPIRRPRQGDERPYPVLPTITQRQPPGPYRARSWGVCNTPLP